MGRPGNLRLRLNGRIVRVARPREPDVRHRHAEARGARLASRLSSPTAVVLVTGSELVRGGRSDENGPFLARELRTRGIEPTRILVVGDRPEGPGAALRESLGGRSRRHLGRARADARRPHRGDAGEGRRTRVSWSIRLLEKEIEEVVRGLSERFRRPYEEFEAGVRKQATIPEGAVSLGLAGTAPGLVLEVDSTVVVVLPGPPGELQRLWKRAVETFHPWRRSSPPPSIPSTGSFVSSACPNPPLPGSSSGPEAKADGLEITICAHDLEVQVDLVVRPGAVDRADRLSAALRRELPQALFADDERPVEEIVLDLAREQGVMIAAAECCTGGLVAARLTSVPGSSDAFLGGVVAYDNRVKSELLGVPARGPGAARGGVGGDARRRWRQGAREALGADVGVSVTGVAGPGGGTDEKPVGLVYLHATGADVGGGDGASPAGRPRRGAAACCGVGASSAAARSDTEPAQSGVSSAG